MAQLGGAWSAVPPMFVPANRSPMTRLRGTKIV